MGIYLQQAKLNGFRTIKDIDINFHRDLNIIIGKNAVGKTNFLTFLYHVLNLKYDRLNDFSSNITFDGDKKFNIQMESHIDLTALKGNSKKITSSYKGKFTIGKKVEKLEGTNLQNLRQQLNDFDLNYNTVFLKHGIPQNYLFVKEALSFNIQKDETLPFSLMESFQSEDVPIFTKDLIFDILVNVVNKEKMWQGDVSKSLKIIIDDVFSDKLKKLKPILTEYSPIKDIRLNSNYSITNNNDSSLVNGLYFEFYIDEQWLPFTSLSDGTKRVFYIISELFTSRLHNYRSYIYLMEEPELGIHPHQFAELLHFINEQSNYAQIIMTTHSPQSLNILDIENLRKIIVASNVKGKTSLRNLNEEEIKKAEKYLEEDYLSDYWLYSDLEN